MKKLLIIIMSIAAFGAYAATDLSNLWGQVTNKVNTASLFSEVKGDITNKVESLIGNVTTVELLAMLRDQYKRDLLTESHVKMQKWHGKSTVSIDTNEWTKTYTYEDGFKFKVKSAPRERTQVDRNAMNKIMAKAKDPRINQTKAKISNLKKMLDNSKSYSLPTAAIEAALANEQAFLDKLTGKVEVVTVKTEIGGKAHYDIDPDNVHTLKVEE